MRSGAVVANRSPYSKINFSTKLRIMPLTVPLYDVSLRLVLFVLVLLTAFSYSADGASSEPCKPDRLSVYKVSIETYWSKEKFPKQYPDWRPIAQFSKTLGRTHNDDYVLWKMGSLASKGVKDFAENGRSDLLDSDTQGRAGVLDEFLLNAIPKGVGESEAIFFADGNHSKVSLITRLIPSPDWFIGIDSYDLCVLGKWLDIVTLELDPMDAGTDNGFTFTAPNWATDPPEKIYRLTAQYPNHAANSFHYPHLKKLPTIATVTFVKMKEYELSQVFTNDIKTNDVEPTGFKPINHYLTRSNTEERKNKKLNPRHCRVSKWSDWSSCSRTCGIGEKRRTRTVRKFASKGGKPCPSLIETKWCSNARCSSAPFEW